MVRRTGGFRRKTRSKLRKNYKDKGKISIRRFLQKFNEGDRVLLNAEPAYHDGMYFPRFHGSEGTITGPQGDCYKVLIRDGGKEKILIVHPVHLRRVQHGGN
ncbi:MAG: 50S ribosomal protein L21e [Nanoarchaeota archaeon]